MTIVVPMGYMGSGSSAITDIVQGFEGYKAANGSSEFIFTHCPNGLFDLEDKLLIGNNSLRSDEALHSFLATMEGFCKKNHWWGAAGFTQGIESDFLAAVYAFVNKLVDFELKTPWYYQHDIPVAKVPMRAFSRIMRSITHGAVRLPTPLRYDDTLLAFPEPSKFYSCAREFIDSVFTILSSQDSNLILDQFLLPHNLWRFDHYFDEGLVCFVVDRDPRDVFLLNKYIWSVDSVDVPFPQDVDRFCQYYRQMRATENPFRKSNIHRIHFEDLVYRYAETLEMISTALGNPAQRQTMLFSADQSINNTQLFTLGKYQEEASIIAEALPEFLYEFPFERQPTIERSF